MYNVYTVIITLLEHYNLDLPVPESQSSYKICWQSVNLHDPAAMLLPFLNVT